MPSSPPVPQPVPLSGTDADQDGQMDADELVAEYRYDLPASLPTRSGQAAGRQAA